jgi:hypothetical protein
MPPQRADLDDGYGRMVWQQRSVEPLAFASDIPRSLLDAQEILL